MHIEYLRTRVPCPSSIDMMKDALSSAERMEKLRRSTEETEEIIAKKADEMMDLLAYSGTDETTNNLLRTLLAKNSLPPMVDLRPFRPELGLVALRPFVAIPPAGRFPINNGHYRCAREVEDYLAGLDGTMHNGVATRILCAAATWAYSDLKTFASMMCHRGLYGEFVGIRVTNDPTFVDTTAYLFLSDTRKLSILAFRGTEPTNLINWLSNASMKMAPQEEGSLHGGFLNAAIVVLPLLKDLLLAKGSLAQALLDVQASWCIPSDLFPANLHMVAYELEAEKQAAARLDALARELQKSEDETWMPGDAREIEERTVIAATKKILGDTGTTQTEVADTDAGPALYICGHSLGGAYAAMAGAVLQLEPTLAQVLENLRSVYTFGQPMFADKAFADAIDEKLGNRVFRHRYKDDIVPRLPGRLNGEFHHFGRSYVSGKGDVWIRETRLGKARGNRAVRGTLTSTLIGALAWVKGAFPGLDWVRLPVSWGDHSPLHYMRVSQSPRSGWEILGAELGGDAPGVSVSPRPASRKKPTR